MEPQSDLTFERYYNLSLRYISYRPRSKKEVEDYLVSKKISVENISKIVKRLEELRFINDLEFSKFWFEQKTRIKPKALKTIQFELLQKGVEKETVLRALEELGKGAEDDLKNAKLLTERKLRSLRNVSPEKRKQRLIGYLQCRGYGFDVIKKILDVEFLR